MSSEDVLRVLWDIMERLTIVVMLHVLEHSSSYGLLAYSFSCSEVFINAREPP